MFIATETILASALYELDKGDGITYHELSDYYENIKKGLAGKSTDEFIFADTTKNDYDRCVRQNQDVFYKFADRYYKNRTLDKERLAKFMTRTDKVVADMLLERITE